MIAECNRCGTLVNCGCGGFNKQELALLRKVKRLFKKNEYYHSDGERIFIDRNELWLDLKALEIKLKGGSK